MYSTGQKILELRKEHSVSQDKLAKYLGIDRTSLSRLENGKRKIDTSELKKVSKYFNVSTDYLLGNTDKKNYYDLNKKEKADLGVMADELLQGTSNDAEADYFGEPMADDQKANLRAALLTALELNKKQAKQKFTPKKYRKDKGSENK